MPEVHLPHLDDHDEEPPAVAPSPSVSVESSPPASVAPAPEAGVHRIRNHTWTKIALEVVLISGGVFLGLAGEQWREAVRHRELAEASLRSFRAEFIANRAQIDRVADRHVKELKGLQDYFAANQAELVRALADPTKPLPPAPDTVTDSALFGFSAWDVALATQSLAYMDADLAAAIASIYRMQQLSESSHQAITQASYTAGNTVYYLRGLMAYFGDSTVYEKLLRKDYDEIIPRIDRALGEAPSSSR
jgi:hypothetical protein